MKTVDLFKEAGSALAANRGRSLLTVLGIVIGIGAVIAMTSLIGGITNSLMASYGLDQSRVVNIYAYSAKGSLTKEDLEQIKLNVPGYEFITSTGYYSGPIKAGKKTEKEGQFVVASPVYFKTTKVTMVCGRLFTDAEDKAGARVVVLERGAATKLFADPEDALGKNVTINNDEYKVIGVCEPQSTYSKNSYLPMGTALTRIFGGKMDNGNVFGFVEEDADVEEVAKKTRTFLANYLGIDEDADDDSSGLFIYTNKELLQEVNATMGAFSVLMGAVASVSLVVGGIGIMNMMLTNVTERIREIGLRKALGARSGDITKQFLIESVMICLVGGVLGIIFGFLAALGLGQVAGGLLAALSGEESAIVPVISPQTVLWATGTCVLIGIVFGYYPARRAAKLNPVESLRFQ